jgi:hypothetical protein
MGWEILAALGIAASIFVSAILVLSLVLGSITFVQMLMEEDE